MERTDARGRARTCVPGSKRLTVVEAFGGRASVSMASDVLGVLDDRAELEGGGHAHGNVIFLAAGGRDVIDARGVGEDLGLVEQRGGGDVRDHEAGGEAGIVGEEWREGPR